MGMSCMRSYMAQSKAQVEKRAIAQGWSIVKRRVMSYPVCAEPNCIARVAQEGEYCPVCDGGYQGPSKTVKKGEFRGYSKNNLAGRAERQAKRRAWGVSRRNKNKRTANRYKRSKVRGSGSGARPRMRRQLGTGGKRPMSKR